jgi:hypothetical protein
MDISTATILFVLFMFAIWFNYRQGFKVGAVGGHLVGVHATVEYLMKNGHLSADNISTGQPATVDEMTAHIVKEVLAKMAKDNSAEA